MVQQDIPPAVEEEIQKLLQKWGKEEKTDSLPLTREQRLWLGRVIHIFQAYELQLPKNWRDKMFTEAMCRYFLQYYVEKEGRDESV